MPLPSPMPLTGRPPAVPSVHDLFVKVMRAVEVIAKDQRNTQQGYNFRGIDAVFDTIGPIIREVGLVVLPVDTVVLSEERYETTRSQAQMRSVTVQVTWEITGPAGDTLRAQTLGEAADSGDKAVAKAQSVAARILWLEGLWVPTGERDVDQDSHERAPGNAYSDVLPNRSDEADRRQSLGKEIKLLGKALGLNKETLYTQLEANYGTTPAGASVAQLEGFLGDLREDALREKSASEPEPEPPEVGAS